MPHASASYKIGLARTAFTGHLLSIFSLIFTIKLSAAIG